MRHLSNFSLRKMYPGIIGQLVKIPFSLMIYFNANKFMRHLTNSALRKMYSGKRQLVNNPFNLVMMYYMKV